MTPPDHHSAVARTREIAEATIAPAAHDLDRAGSFPADAMAALGKAGLLALNVPTSSGGSGLGPRAFAEVNAILAEADPSVAMVYMMHVCASEVIVAGARTTRSPVLEAALTDMSRGKHLSTLAFSEAGSRSHFWAPLSRASRTAGGVLLNAKKSWVTSAGVADSYVVTTLSRRGQEPDRLDAVPRAPVRDRDARRGALGRPRAAGDRVVPHDARGGGGRRRPAAHRGGRWLRRQAERRSALVQSGQRHRLPRHLPSRRGGNRRPSEDQQVRASGQHLARRGASHAAPDAGPDADRHRRPRAPDRRVRGRTRRAPARTPCSASSR